MAPLHQPQDKPKEKASDAIRTAWNVFQKETWENRGKRNGRNYVQMSSRELEIIFRDNARRRWRSILKDHRMDVGAWIMTNTDKEEISALLGWNRGEMIDACEEEWGIFVVSAALYMSLHGADTVQEPGEVEARHDSEPSWTIYAEHSRTTFSRANTNSYAASTTCAAVAIPRFACPTTIYAAQWG
jgi:hypothetical protein